MGRRASVSRRATVYAVSPRSAKVTPASYGVFSRRVEFSHGASRRVTTMGPAGQGELSSPTADAVCDEILSTRARQESLIECEWDI